MSEAIRYVIAEVGKKPVIKTEELDIHMIQNYVGGMFECVDMPPTRDYNGPYISIYLNDMGKLIPLPVNMDLGSYDVVHGTVLFIAVDPYSGEDVSLTDEMLQDVLDYIKASRPVRNYPEDLVRRIAAEAELQGYASEPLVAELVSRTSPED